MSPDEAVTAILEAKRPMTKAEVEKIVYAIADQAEDEGYASGLADGGAAL